MRAMKQFAVAGLLAAWIATPAAAQDKSIIVQSTTSTMNSGLYKHLLPIFKEDTGITVNVVAPGATDTPMLRDPAKSSSNFSERIRFFDATDFYLGAFT